METTGTRTTSLLGLLRSLTGDTKRLIRQEIHLAKTEISEKLSSMGKNGIAIAVAAVVAYAGAIVFMIGLGWVVAWALQKAGMDAEVARFLGLIIIGFVIAVVGAIMLLKATKTLSHQSLTPEKTIHTLKELKAGHYARELEPTAGEEKLSSDEIQARVEQTEGRMSETLDEIGYRLSPTHIKEQVRVKIEANPYRAGLIAMIAGLISGLLLRRRSRHA